MKYSRSDQVPVWQDWLYFEGTRRDVPRLALAFNPDTRILEAITWNVRAADPEIKLDNVMARYKGTHFVGEDLPWTNPHIAPEEVLFRGEATGVQILYLKYSKRVDSLSWESSTPTQQNTKPVVQWTP
jgi:hypothetical protein